jgi:hypothetical protein
MVGMDEKEIIESLLDELYDKAAPLRRDTCYDDYGCAYSAIQHVLGLSMTKYGTAEYAWSAISTWLDAPFDNAPIVETPYPIGCRINEVIKALAGAAQSVFDPENERLLICDEIG